ncbi:uncharacterized protein LOC144091264 [Stigmatopora argus]
MRGYSAAWVSFGMISSILLASCAAECSGNRTRLRPLPGDLPRLSGCLMECTQMTFARKVQLRDTRDIRLQDSTDGGLGQYCWSTEIKCNVGEIFQRAFVVLPLHASPLSPESVTVRWANAALPVDTTDITIPDSCGLRYDVSEHFGPGRRLDSFCVEVIRQQDVQVPKCPPFLVTFWQRSVTQI